MENITHALVIIWLHWLADFAAQTSWMAQNKSKNNAALFVHCVVYTAPFMIFGVWYGLLNGAIHFCVDYCTSRITAKLWLQENKHDFFVVVGLDQAIHMTTLLLTARWMGIL